MPAEKTPQEEAIARWWWQCNHENIGLPWCPTCDGRFPDMSEADGESVRTALRQGRKRIYNLEAALSVCDGRLLAALAEVSRLQAEVVAYRTLTVKAAAAMVGAGLGPSPYPEDWPPRTSKKVMREIAACHERVHTYGADMAAEMHRIDENRRRAALEAPNER